MSCNDALISGSCHSFEVALYLEHAMWGSVNISCASIVKKNYTKKEITRLVEECVLNNLYKFMQKYCSPVAVFVVVRSTLQAKCGLHF